VRLPVVHEAWLAELANELRLRRTAVGVVRVKVSVKLPVLAFVDHGLRRIAFQTSIKALLKFGRIDASQQIV
jgi:hypothetical protein